MYVERVRLVARERGAERSWPRPVMYVIFKYILIECTEKAWRKQLFLSHAHDHVTSMEIERPRCLLSDDSSPFMPRRGSRVCEGPSQHPQSAAHHP